MHDRSGLTAESHLGIYSFLNPDWFFSHRPRFMIRMISRQHFIQNHLRSNETGTKVPPGPALGESRMLGDMDAEFGDEDEDNDDVLGAPGKYTGGYLDVNHIAIVYC